MTPAEQAVLGSLLQRPDMLEPVFDLIGPEDFTGQHVTLAQVMLDLWAAGRPVDPQTVLAEVMRRGLVERTGGGPYLHTLIERAFTPSIALTYAAEVQEASRRRHLASLLAELTQRADNGHDPVDNLLEDLAGRVDRLRQGGRDDEKQPMTAEEFVVGDDTYDWVVPGLLERGDRVLVTGAEGFGKSTLLRQIAVCLAAGVHPFALRPVEPARVMFIDCENDAAQSKREFRALLAVASRSGRGLGGRLMIDCRPEGMDLTKPRDASWLLRRVTRHRPDVLITGSLYKLHAGNPNDEELARKLAVALDAARLRANCALIIEAHAPHKETGAKFRLLRPAGSSLFLRWPGFGYGLRPSDDDTSVFDVVAWRGPRDVRAWPERLARGPQGGWPWVEGAPESAWGAA